MRTIVHVTHEAVQKSGGIGAVLEGLLTSEPYRLAEQRTVLVGPLFEGEGRGHGRLGPGGEVLYSSLDGLTQHPVSRALDPVRRRFHVGIVYGHRPVRNPLTGRSADVEVLLVDTSRIELNELNAFKGRLWECFGLDSRRHERSWEYDLYVKLAGPALAALQALGAADADDECVVVAHEWMGLPTALGAIASGVPAFRTIFYAHEVSAVRRLVESHPAHDLMFYNVLSAAIAREQYLEDVFGPQDDCSRHALVRLSWHCDRILAVGDHVVKELRFLGPPFAGADIVTTYNGIPAGPVTPAERHESGRRMRAYAAALLGEEPDLVFTHVARQVTSKGFWRDLRVLEHLEPVLRDDGRTAVMFILSTDLPGRLPEDVRRMERRWHWPLAHRERDPDLSFNEAEFYPGVQVFNARSRQIKVVLVNQFGWDREVCGERMPAEMSFVDIRRGTDAEFGQSVYEPFGISQLEALSCGAICVLSDACGCAGFVEEVAGGARVPNVIVAEYCGAAAALSPEELLGMSMERREALENQVARRVAGQLAERLPADRQGVEALLASGWELARRMSWDVVAAERVMPAIESLARPKLRICAA